MMYMCEMVVTPENRCESMVIISFSFYKCNYYLFYHSSKIDFNFKAISWWFFTTDTITLATWYRWSSGSFQSWPSSSTIAFQSWYSLWIQGNDHFQCLVCCIHFPRVFMNFSKTPLCFDDIPKGEIWPMRPKYYILRNTCESD